MYGRRNMTRFLRRQGHPVAFCTTDRLMRRLGMNGVVRGRRLRTTIPDKDAVRAGDKLQRDFTASAPDRVWWPTSPTWPPGRAGRMWRSSSTPTRAASSAGRCRRARAPLWWSRR